MGEKKKRKEKNLNPDSFLASVPALIVQPLADQSQHEVDDNICLWALKILQTH